MKLLTTTIWTTPEMPDVEFSTRPLTMREAIEFREIAKTKGGESVEVHEYLFSKGLVAWSGIEDGDGKTLEATAAAAMGLPYSVCNALAMRISVLSGLLRDPDAEKNSQSPLPSTDSGENSTAAPADGDAIAAPKTPRRRQSGK